MFRDLPGLIFGMMLGAFALSIMYSLLKYAFKPD